MSAADLIETTDRINTSTLICIGGAALLIAGLGHGLTVLDVVGLPFFSASGAALRSAMEGTPFFFADVLDASSSMWKG